MEEQLVACKYDKFGSMMIPKYTDCDGKPTKLGLLKTLQYGLCSVSEKNCSGISCGECILDPKNIKEFEIWFNVEGKELFNVQQEEKEDEKK